MIGDIFLLIVTLFWGISFPFVENAIHDIDPIVFVTVRFFCAAVFLIPTLFLNYFKHSKTVIFAGILLGACNAIVYISQTIGLETLTSAEAAFITSINVVLVPFILPFFSLAKPKIQDIIGSILCFTGLFILLGHDLNHIHIGYVWVSLTAVFVAISIAYLQKITKKSICLNLLAFYQIAFTCFFSSLFTFGKNYHAVFNFSVISALLFCAFFATTLALWLQTKYQHYTSASRAAMIFCLEPLFASITAYLINGETLSWQAWICGLFIFLGIMIASTGFRFRS